MISEEDLRFGESIGVLAAIIVLIIVFGAAVAGVTPIIMAIFAIVVTLGIVGLFGVSWDFSFFTPNLISMMGLAVGIDYSLFIVSRYREERHTWTREARGHRGFGRDREPGGVLQRHDRGARAGWACCWCRPRSSAAWRVAPSSWCSCRSLRRCRCCPRSCRCSATRSTPVASSTATARWSTAGPVASGIARLARVMARPVTYLVLAATFMIALSLPYWLQSHPEDDGRGIKTGLAGIGTLPDEAQSKQAFDAILALFPKAGSQASADVVIVTDGVVGTPGAEVGAPGSWRPTTPLPSPRWNRPSPTIRRWERRARRRSARTARSPWWRYLWRARPRTPRAKLRRSRSSGSAPTTCPQPSRDTDGEVLVGGDQRLREGLLRYLRHVHTADHPGACCCCRSSS